MLFSILSCEYVLNPLFSNKDLFLTEYKILGSSYGYFSVI